MRVPLFVSALVVLVVAGCQPRVHAGDVTFPHTEPGRHAREFFLAFNRDEAAMRAFYAANISADDLKARTPEDRLGVWHEMREVRGTLTPVRALSNGADFAVIVARDAHGELAQFRFNCHAEAPHTMLGVMVSDFDDSAGSGGSDRGEATAPASGPPPGDADIVAALTSQLDSLAGAGEFSGVAVLDKGGQQLYAHAFGQASREPAATNTLDTRFNLGSINKIFTTVATLQLAHAGKLALSDHIDKYLPDYPRQAASKITIEMLLHHRAGVPDFFDSPVFAKNPHAVATLADWYVIVRVMPLRFDPGAREEYSNGGYVLLGMIIAKASGEDYYDYVRHHIYTPAGMTRSDHFAAAVLPPDTAIPYTRHGGGSGLQPFRDLPGRGSPAGGGYATAGDLVRFATALRDGRLLDAQASAALVGHGGGLGIAGGSPGVNGLLEIDGPYTLVVLANRDPPAAERLAHTVGRMVQRAAGTGGGEQKIMHAHH